MQITQIIQDLHSLANPENLAGMARYGINTTNTLGISMPQLRRYARSYKNNHAVALELWKSGIHEARILAALIDDPNQVTTGQMDRWAADLDSWDVCDQCCSSLFVNTPYAYAKAVEWSHREEEFVKRAGYAMMAILAVRDKKAEDEVFSAFFPLIIEGAGDERNFVKKAVNWALRQIGKRSRRLHEEALQVGEQIKAMDNKSARWIAADALRELRDEKTIRRIKR